MQLDPEFLHIFMIGISLEDRQVCFETFKELIWNDFRKKSCLAKILEKRKLSADEICQKQDKSCRRKGFET